MSPEFVAILDEREQLGLWFVLLPMCLGFLALLVSAVKARKGIALIHTTLLAIASVAIPTLMGGFWWSELSSVATSHEDREWILNHDGGMIIAPLSAILIATAFWVFSVLVLSIRSVIARLRKAKEKKSNILTPISHPNNRMQSDAAKPRR
jgi:hypothetical protein